MSKFGEFLKQTSEISNKDRLITCGCIIGLWGVAIVLNALHYKKSIECINKDLEIDLLETKNAALRMELLKGTGDNQDEMFE